MALDAYRQMREMGHDPNQQFDFGRVLTGGALAGPLGVGAAAAPVLILVASAGGLASAGHEFSQGRYDLAAFDLLLAGSPYAFGPVRAAIWAQGKLLVWGRAPDIAMGKLGGPVERLAKQVGARHCR